MRLLRKARARTVAFYATCQLVIGCGASHDGPIAATTPTNPSSPTVSGRVVSVIDANNVGITGVHVSVDEENSLQTAEGGVFSASAGTGMHALSFIHPDFIARQTHALSPAADLLVSLMPASFDLAAFEQLSPRTGGLRRWVSNPSLAVLTNSVDYLSAAVHFRVTDHVVPGDGLGCMVNGIASAIDEMSGGALTFDSVTHIAPAVGSYIDVTAIPDGTILVMPARDLGANGRGIAYAGPTPDVLVRGAIWINADVLPLCSTTADGVYPHELGHALGYQHVTLEPSIMSGIGPAPTPTEFDREAIAWIYQRPAGNRAPDVDPPNYTIGVSVRR
jgi:hypothetical protein